MPHPTNIKSRTKSRVLEVSFDDGSVFELPFEYLRVYSPSAEVRGHGPGQETAAARQARSRHQPKSSRSATTRCKLVFDDGHDTGLYTWAYLYELGRDRPQKWQSYLDRLQELGIPYPTVCRKSRRRSPSTSLNNK